MRRGDIVDYRLDVYGGFCVAACANFNNVMSISACEPRQQKCSSDAFPTRD